MTTQVVFHSRSTPDVHGYPDLVLDYPASCCPNWRTPWLAGGLPWRLAYGWVAPGAYPATCIEHPKYGHCLRLDQVHVPSRTPNPRHLGAKYLSGVLVHSGQTAEWRGSAGCLTVHPLYWPRFISTFIVGQPYTVEVIV